MIPLKDDNPTELYPVVTVAVMGGCILAFLWQLSLGPAQQQAIYALGVVPAVLFDLKALPPEVALVSAEATLVTSLFLHGGWLHLAGNMLYLWIFGNNVEDAVGHGRFVFFYLVCGMVAALSQALPTPEGVIPIIGASGAISGILGAYLLLYPRARVLVVIPFGFYLHPMALPAGVVIGLWFALQVVNSLAASGQEGGVAWLAHVGGFVAGVLLILVPGVRRRGVRLWQPGRAAR